MSEQLIIQIDTPYVTPTEFAKRSGQCKRTVEEKVRQGIYPTLPRKSPSEAVMINMLALAKKAAEQAKWFKV